MNVYSFVILSKGFVDEPFTSYILLYLFIYRMDVIPLFSIFLIILYINKYKSIYEVKGASTKPFDNITKEYTFISFIYLLSPH